MTPCIGKPESAIDDALDLFAVDREAGPARSWSGDTELRLIEEIARQSKSGTEATPLLRVPAPHTQTTYYFKLP